LTLTARRHPVPFCGIKFHLPATLPHGISDDNTMLRATPYALGAYRRSISAPWRAFARRRRYDVVTKINPRDIPASENTRANRVVSAQTR